MASLAEALPAEIARVTEIKEIYIGLRGTPQVNVEPAIAMMGASIERAVEASAGGDVLKMLLAYEELKGFDV